MGRSSRIRRRTFLQGTTALLASGGAAFAEERRGPVGGGSFPGLIVRQFEPSNLEMPFPTLDRFLVPANRFFVRSHFATPQVDAASWKLRVEGAVERPLELTFEELRQLPSRTAPVLLECSGNSRIFITPRAEGLPWELGGVGTAEWTGVPLAAILDRAGVRSSAVDVILEGTDSGEIASFRNPYASPGRIAFARSVPIAKARDDVFLAYRMNGEPLPTAHGFPVRAIVPSWYGMASVKWLAKIIVTDRPFRGFFQTIEYGYYQREHGQPVLTPVTELQVKSLIARPALNEIVSAGQTYRVHGATWTGNSEVSRVEFSSDAGRTWTDARLLDQAVPHAWRFWEYTWQVPAGAARYTLMSRATDRRGRTQSDRHDPDRRNTMISHTVPSPVEAR
jgi:DMSO/TMAO reductase YedYZ molybdopterin-dependent catalytic subunit